MTLREQLDADLKEALKAGDERRKLALRSIKAAIQRATVAGADRQELNEDQVLSTIRAQAKQRRDSIEEFTKAGRMDLVDEEKAELVFIESYLPQMLSRAQVEAAAKVAIAESGATTPAQMGAVMRVLMPRVKDQADGRMVNEVVRDLLTKKP